MRITVRIDDDVYRAAKEQAAKTGRAIGEFIEDAMRRALRDPNRPHSEPLPPLPTYGGTGVLPGVDLTSNSALRDVIDGDEPVDPAR